MGEVEGVALPSDQDASGRSFGANELDLLRQVLDSGTLTSTKGSMAAALEADFARLMGAAGAVACSSGSTAIHAAVAALDPDPGDEVITTPITDMGALTPLLYQGAIPVFADVDPLTGSITADSVRERISERTVAVVVTHLFGRPAEVDAIVEVAQPLDIPVVEDAAQAYLARVGERPVGTIGDLGCFSLQQGKHITAGEGGLLVAGDPTVLADARRWIHKGWDYGATDPDHRTMALNGRMSELQAAVAAAQLARLPATVEARIKSAEALSAALADVPGLDTPSAAPGDVHSYWRYPLLVDPDAVVGGPDGLAEELRSVGVAAAPRYIRKPAFRCGVFADRKGLGASGFPFTTARPEALDHDPAGFAGTTAFLDRVLVVPWNERIGEEHVDRLATELRAAVGRRSL